MTRKASVHIRDKAMTRQRLIASVGSLLAREGFKGMGVNAVAREAGVDKVLIYRYFGGLPGLIAAFGKEGDFWPSPLELAGGDIKRFAALPPEQQLKVFSHQFIQGLRNRPVTICIMAWEMVEANELTRELESVREQGILSFFQMFFRFDKNEPAGICQTGGGGPWSGFWCDSRQVPGSVKGPKTA